MSGQQGSSRAQRKVSKSQAKEKKETDKAFAAHKSLRAFRERQRAEDEFKKLKAKSDKKQKKKEKKRLRIERGKLKATFEAELESSKADKKAKRQKLIGDVPEEDDVMLAIVATTPKARTKLPEPARSIPVKVAREATTSKGKSKLLVPKAPRSIPVEVAREASASRRGRISQKSARAKAAETEDSDDNSDSDDSLARTPKKSKVSDVRVQSQKSSGLASRSTNTQIKTKSLASLSKLPCMGRR